MGDLLKLIPFIGNILGKLIPDKAAAAAAQVQLNQMAAQGALTEELTQLAAITSAQSDINKTEAANTSVFVSGWRPAIGWVCGLALAFQYIVRPIAGSIVVLTGHSPVALPGLDDNLWQLMFGMLGMGTLRSLDKIKGVASK